MYVGMAGSSHSEKGLPEGLVNDLHRRLRWHGFWDSLLSFSPPLLAFSCLIFSFFYAGWIAMEVAVFTFAAGLGLFLGFDVCLGG